MTKREKQLLKSIGETPDDLVFWAFRYFIGRGSIASSVFACRLSNSIEFLGKETQNKIINEINSKFYEIGMLEHLGIRTDYWCREAWERVRTKHREIKK